MDQESKISKTFVLHILYILSLLLVVIPLLIVASYDRPGADDWSYGKAVWNALNHNGNLPDVLKTCFSVVKETYLSWEGRYSCVFFDSLMPGVWGEHFYGITPFIILFSLIGSEYILFSSLLGRKNKKYVVPILVPALIMQILFVPSIVESFYWYTGAINYSFFHSLSFVLIALFFNLLHETYSSRKYIFLYLFVVLLSILVGGSNFSTSLYSVLAIWMLFAYYVFLDRKKSIRMLPAVIILSAGFAVAVLSPGNSMRISSNFGGVISNPVLSVWMSVSKTCENIWLWTTSWQFDLVILMVIPFIAYAVKQMDWSFKLPGLFSFLSVGLFSAQIFPTMYVDGTVGGGRQIALLMYSYWIWILINLIYWIGWIYRKTHYRIKNEKINKIVHLVFENAGKTALMLAIVCFAGMCLTEKIKTVSSARALKDIITGSAAGYAAEWDDRYRVLHDDSLKEVGFRRLENRPETILYSDFEYEAPYTWVNDACASYYGKDSITVSFD